MDLQRRSFLEKAFKVGGLSALVSVGMTSRAAYVFAGSVYEMQKRVTARKSVAGGGPPACSELGTTGTTITAHYDTGQGYKKCFSGNTYTNGSEAVICSVKVYAREVGDIDAIDWVVQLWTMTGTSLLAVVSNGTSVAQAGSVFGASDTEVEFTFSTRPTLSASTTYAITLGRSDGSYNAANYLEIGVVANDGGSALFVDGFAWRDVSASHIQNAVFSAEAKMVIDSE